MTHTIQEIAVDPVNAKKAQERTWRDSELERTDKLVILPDFPDDLLTYRQELRDYPVQPDFPNGTRPTI